MYQSRDDKIRTLNNSLLEAFKKLSDKDAELEGCNTHLKEALSELKRISYNKHLDLNTYKEWLLTNTKKTNKYYDFGKGKRRVHTIIAESIKQREEINKFIENIGFNPENYKNADDIVYYLNQLISDLYPNAKYYASDSTLYGEREYWATPKETIKKLNKKGKSFDCDDMMVLRYACIHRLLSDYYPEELWRLRCFIVDLWTGGGHAMIGWVKKGVNDWVPIETTFYNSKQNTLWRKNYTIQNQILYQIRYSFNEEGEYERV